MSDEFVDEEVQYDEADTDSTDAEGQYRITVSLEDGTFPQRIVTTSTPPLKGETFEVEETVTRVAQVHRVERLEGDEWVTIPALVSPADEQENTVGTLVVEELPRPSESHGRRDEWVEYAISRGMDREIAENSYKSDLIEAYPADDA